jgi:hypothetical protein
MVILLLLRAYYLEVYILMLNLYFKVISFEWMTRLFAYSLVSFTTFLKDKKESMEVPVIAYVITLPTNIDILSNVITNLTTYY